jgi:hypothetical protein
MKEDIKCAGYFLRRVNNIAIKKLTAYYFGGLED